MQLAGNRGTFWQGEKRPCTGPTALTGKGTCALHIKFLATRFNGGEQMLQETFASLQTEENSTGAGARGASLLLHFSRARCSCKSQHRASDITTDAAATAAAATLILHPQGPMEMQDFPLIRAVDTKIAHLTFANTKQWSLSRNWQKVMQKSLDFLSKMIFIIS